MEKIENIGFGGLKLIQDSDGFRFGIDAVLLADFANSIYPKASDVIDLGTGNGAIPLILSSKNNSCSIMGIDVQERAIEMATRSCLMNGLEGRIDFFREDVAKLREARPELRQSADLVVSNPPYVPRGSGIENDKSAKYIARQETTADLEEFIATAAWLLREKGHMCMVHRPSRLVDLFYLCRSYRLEPKHVRFVTPKRGEIPNIVLLHCALGGGNELRFMDELPVYDEDGSYTMEIQRIYGRI